MQGIHLRKYGVGATIDFELYEIDGVDLRTDAVSATGDVTLIRDGGGGSVLDADTFTDEGQSYSLDLSIAEMTAASIVVYVVDQGTKTWLDRVIFIETYGHASAQHAFDLDTPSVAQSADNNTLLAAMTGTDSKALISTDAQDMSGTLDVNVKTATSTALDSILKTSTFALAMTDAIWGALLTGATYNVATSAGRRLRQIEQAFVHASGTIATVTDGHTFTLDGGAVATANYYIGDRLNLIEGVGAGQSRIIVAYTSGKVVTLDSNFTTNPNTSTLYEVDSADVHVSLSDADQAQGFVATYTNTTTITLDAAAVATTDYYLGSLIVFTHGAGAGQQREITAYSSGRVVTMSPALATAVDTTTVWHVQAAVSAAEIKTEMEQDGDSLLDTIRDELANATDGLSALKTLIDAVPTVAEIQAEMEENGASLLDTIRDQIGTAGAGLTNINLPNQTMDIVGNITGNLSGSVESVTNDVGITQAGADKAWGTAARTLTANTNLNDITVADIIAGIADGSNDLQEMMRIIFAALSGKTTGGGTVTLNFRDSADSKNRITATVDANGNRTAVTLDGT